MARKNRKKRQGGHVFPAPLAVILVVVAGLSLLYICLNAKTEALGREIKMLEVKRDVLRDTLIKAQYEWAQAQSPANLDKVLKDHGLVMTWPSLDQIVRVRTDGAVEGLAASRVRLAGKRYAHVDRIVMND